MRKLILLLSLFPLLAIAAQRSELKLKTQKELLNSLANIFEISINDTIIQQTYTNVKDRLPRNGRPDEMSSPVVTALTELASSFCSQKITAEKKMSFGERTIFYDVDFTRGPVQFSDYLIEKLSNEISLRAWGRKITNTEKATLKNLVDKSSEKNLEAPENTEKVALSLCTSITTSLAFLVK